LSHHTSLDLASNRSQMYSSRDVATESSRVIESISIFDNSALYVPIEELETKAVGGKTIKYAGSFVLMANRFAGPGMLALPFVFQQGIDPIPRTSSIHPMDVPRRVEYYFDIREIYLFISLLID